MVRLLTGALLAAALAGCSGDSPIAPAEGGSSGNSPPGSAEDTAEDSGSVQAQPGLASSPIGLIADDRLDDFEQIGDDDDKAGLTGTVAVTLTDAPGDFEAVPVTIASVEAHGADQGWIMLVDQPFSVDLLTLQGGATALLGSAELAAGGYDQVRLVVSAAAVVVDGVTHELLVPSGSQSGIKLSYDYEVQAGVAHELRLDFDAHESVIVAGDEYLLQPVITVDYFGPAKQ